MRHILFFTLLAASLIVTSVAAEEYREPRPVDGAENALGVAYLPHRITGEWQDHWLKMNVHWPRGLADDERRPCILLIHGGGYGGGDKDTGFCKDARERAIAAGFVVANMNYILGRDIFPQVFHDFDAAVRFLRANAKRFHIDPDRIGSWGFSAGGWLSSSGAFTDAGDLYFEGKTAISESWPLDDPRRDQLLRRVSRPRRDEPVPLLVPMDDPQPLYGQFSSRIQALQGDFTQFEANMTSSAPAILTYVGKGGVNKMQTPAEAAGVDYLALELVHPKKKFDGARAVHVPPLEMLVPTPDGKGQMELQDRVIAWFQQKLIDNPTTPAPEFRPNQRVFADEVDVSTVTTSPDVRVHYTTDGSVPTLDSPVWNRDTTFTESKTLKAIAVKQGMKPSGVVTVRFERDRLPPTITGPEETILKGKVGQPLKITFTTSADESVTWRLAAHYRSTDGRRFDGNFTDFNGLAFDAETGTLSGTPKQSFTHTLQVQAGWKPATRAGIRTCVLHITD